MAVQQVMIHIGSLKKDMIILEKSEFSMLRNENDVNFQLISHTLNYEHLNHVSEQKLKIKNYRKHLTYILVS